MKNSRTFYSVFFLFCIFFTSNSAFSQKGLFVDAELGILPIPTIMMGQVSLTSGYRFSENIAAGLEYRIAGSVFNTVHLQSMNGIGLTFRFTKNQFFGKLTQGIMLTAESGDDTPGYYDTYRGGSLYNTLSLGCRFRSGFLLGGTLTFARRAKFTRNYDDDDFWLVDSTTEDIRTSLGFLGVVVGVTFPRETRW